MEVVRVYQVISNSQQHKNKFLTNINQSCVALPYYLSNYIPSWIPQANLVSILNIIIKLLGFFISNTNHK